ncbi:hypothetical protein L914_04054 [Phytophthora nicotianae]|uniref:Uncharacterized protein n=1 Tax=Phytophthora nicotianae TaxID=4792 RepID=W2NUG0_PHYNI|nr:hypothetical protein L914_04054 [Phytophthora nicotianae]
MVVAVPPGTAYAHCRFGAMRLLKRDILGYTTVRVPVFLCELRAQFEQRDAPCASSRSFVQALRLHSVLGLVRPHHIRNVLHQDVLRLRRISMGRKSFPTKSETSLVLARPGGFKVHYPLDNSTCRVASHRR